MAYLLILFVFALLAAEMDKSSRLRKRVDALELELRTRRDGPAQDASARPAA